MHFQVRTDNHLPNSEELTDKIRDEVEGALAHRYHGQVRRVEVYLQDLNGHKHGVDKRCSIEVSLAGHSPVAAEDKAGHRGGRRHGRGGQGPAGPRTHDRQAPGPGRPRVDVG